MMSTRIEFTLALIVLLFPTSLAATISVPADYTSIQAAIDAAQDGDVIEVQSGIYYENVNVDKPLTLRGLRMPTVDAGGKGSAITLSADGITVEGFVATNSGSYTYYGGIEITSDCNIIKGNSVNANGNGIFLNKSSNNNIEGNNVSRNYFGIRIHESNNNIIKGNKVSYNKLCGIRPYSSINNHIEGNDARYNSDGIVLLYSGNNTLKGNIVNNNRYNGIELLYNSNSNIMRDNQMSGNRYNFGASGVNDIDISNLIEGKPVYYLLGINNTTFDSSSDAGVVYCFECNNITVTGLNLNNNSFGVRFDNSSNLLVKGNNFINNENGIYLYSSTNTSIEENNASCNQNGIYLSSTCSNNTLKGNYVSRNEDGIYVETNSYGNNTIVSNEVIYNENGIYLKNFYNSAIIRNEVIYNDNGLYLLNCDNNTIIENNITYSKNYGINLILSSNNSLEGNNASNNYEGIYLYKSRRNIMRNNMMFSNLYNFGAEFEIRANSWEARFYSNRINNISSLKKDQSDVESNWENDIDKSNLVEGKPIYYLVNESDIVLDSNTNAGVVYCIDCENITLNGLRLTNNVFGTYFFNTIESKIENCYIKNNELEGIIFAYSMNNSICCNNISHNQNGIGLFDSNSSSIAANEVRFNSMSGITLVFESCLNTITDNQIERNDGGVIFYRSSNNAIIGNNVTNNNLSIIITDSTNNTIEGNNATYSELGIFLSASKESTIEGNNASCNEMGIVLQASNDNIINGNNASYNENSGIELVDSNNNDIRGNRVDYNEMGGFVLSESSNNTIRANNASYNEMGIGTDESSNNTLFMNSFCHNGFLGIGLMFNSSNNDIYRNSLVDNEVVSAIDNCTNTWDDGTVGNYYSDFNCTDSDGDGICDSVCRIFGGESVDRYPLAAPPT